MWMQEWQKRRRKHTNYEFVVLMTDINPQAALKNKPPSFFSSLVCAKYYSITVRTINIKN